MCIEIVQLGETMRTWDVRTSTIVQWVSLIYCGLAALPCGYVYCKQIQYE